MTTIARILIATDATPASDEVIDYGLALARQLRAAVHVLHVVNVPIPPATATPSFRFRRHDWADGLVNRAQQTMSDREVRLSASGVPFTTEVLVGYPVMTTADVAASMGCDLIVAGESGRPSSAGPGANRLAAIAPCPVLLVQESDRARRSAA